MYSAGFSKDSRLFASDLLGNVYQWDVQNKNERGRLPIRNTRKKFDGKGTVNAPLMQTPKPT